MIDRKNFTFYNYIMKDTYVGGCDGMRYMLKKVKLPDDAGNGIEACIWPEPYGYNATPEEKKQRHIFPCKEVPDETTDDIVEWLNKQLVEQKALWSL